jgi:hypothetical protein
MSFHRSGGPVCPRQQPRPLGWSLTHRICPPPLSVNFITKKKNALVVEKRRVEGTAPHYWFDGTSSLVAVALTNILSSPFLQIVTRTATINVALLDTTGIVVG